ncbi:hypothetical protein AB4Y45_33235 [Paraburkholderia sp. EG287A]|uniref:hypothetical protein n=1 Tax=Paraburkholderia sp. EG287A TaxID=3237012 RepID=UPI0034D32AE9
MNSAFNFVISLWPAVVLVVAATTILMPDRYRMRTDSDDDCWSIVVTLLWLVALFWWVPAYMTQHGASDFNVPGFWPAVLQTLRSERAWVHAGLMPVFLGVYFVVGLTWAVVYFWLYARRLGHVYVVERDAWLARVGVRSLEGLSAEQKLKFRAVIGAVQKQMLYRGDFPLRPFQQKRFFTGNLVLWPLTLVCYLLGDLVVDVARSVWFALRNWIHVKWVAGMAEYHEDEVICREYDAAVTAEAAASGAQSSAKGKARAVVQSAFKRFADKERDLLRDAVHRPT